MEEKDIFNAWKNPDKAVVAEFASFDGGNKFVFATKYCSFLKPDYYPIYDGIVVNVLGKFNEMIPFIPKYVSLNRLRDKQDYSGFKKNSGLF